MFERTELRDDAWIDYDRAWLDATEADALFAELLETLPWEQRSIFALGKEVPQPRLCAWQGTLPYRYSGQTLEVQPLTGTLAELTARASEAVGVDYNHVMANLYRDGHDRIGLHADNEPELGRDPVIASLSLGVVRRFEMAPKDRRARRQRWRKRLGHGSLLVMGGRCQHTWRHALPPMRAVQLPRINVTFRRLLGPPGWRGPRDG